MSRATVTTFGHRGTTSSIRTEISRELVNATDGAGLNLQSGGKIELTSGAAQFGTSDFSIEFVLNQEKENTSDSYIFVTHTAGHNRLLISHDASDDNLVLDFRNASSASTKKDLAYDMNQDFGSPTHYVITFDRDGLATLYKNGNSVATVDISSLSAIDIGTDSSGSRIGTGSTDGVIGTFYRFRTWNYLVDAKALFENGASVDYSSQWGSQTSKILNGTSWTGASGSTQPTSWTVGIAGTFTLDSSSGSGAEPALKISRNGSNNNPYIHQNFAAVIGKKYRVKYRVKNIDATSVIVGIGSTAVGEEYNQSTYTSTSWADYEATFTATTTVFSVYVIVSTSTGTQSGYIDSVTVEQVGAVVDMDLAAANPTQSRMVQDRAGAADGTASASNVSQVQPIIQGNLTSLRVGSGQTATPADNQVLVDGGTVSAPAYAFAHTTNTGMWSRGGGKLDFATGGVTRIAIDADGHVTVDGGDLKIKSPTGAMQDAELLFNSTNNSAVYGATFAIDSKIISTANQTDNAYGSKLKFYTSDNSDNVTERLTLDSSGNASIQASGADAVRTLNVHGTNGASELYTFAIEADGANAKTNFKVGSGGGAAATKLTIDANGNLMLGTPAAGSAAAIFHISAAAPRIRLEDTSAPANYSQIAADNGQLTLAADGGGGQGSSAIIAQVDGSERMRIDGAGDITSASATAGSPVLTLENTTADAASSQLVFNKNRTATNDDILGTVRFKGNNNAGTPEVIEYATIYAQSSTITDGAEDGKLIFRTMKDGTLDARLTINSSGDIEQTGGAFVLNDGSGAEVGKLSTLGGNNITICGTQTDHCGVSMATNAILPATQHAVNNNTVDLGANGNAFKDLYLGGGINLGNQTMSSYQTGDWYPLMYYQNPTGVTIGGTAYASQGVGNYTITWGHYVKVGKLVHVEGYVKVTVANTGSFANDNIGIQGLPFTHRNATNANTMLMINTTKDWGNTIASGVVASNSTVAVWQTSSGGGNLADDIGAVTNLQIWINGTYFAES